MIDKIKRDLDTNWAKAVNFIPKKNEIIIYDFINAYPKIKLGDGIHKINELDFCEPVIKIDSHNYKIIDGVLIAD